MADIRVLIESELRSILPLGPEPIDCIEAAFEALATKPVVMPDILSFAIPEANGEVDVKTAYVPGLESFAIKVSPGFFDNPKIGLSSLNGLMMLFSAKTGLVEALLLDNGYLTDLRTAAAGAVAAKHLSREDSTNVAIFGAGVQARLQLEALTLVRPITTAKIWARRAEQAEALADSIAEDIEILARSEPDPELAVQTADIIVTTTPASEALLNADWILPGQHITAMGSDAGHKNELEPEIVAGADLYVPDRLSQCRALGELRTAIETGFVPANAIFAELGQIIAGEKAGRTSDEAITVADLTGTGVQDTAIATLALKKAIEAGAGTTFES